MAWTVIPNSFTDVDEGFGGTEKKLKSGTYKDFVKASENDALMMT